MRMKAHAEAYEEEDTRGWWRWSNAELLWVSLESE